MTQYTEYFNTSRETMTQEEKRALQNEKLNGAIARGYHRAPVIRELWDDAGITPDDIQTIEDLAKAPVFRKDNARERMTELGQPYGGRLTKSLDEISEGRGGYIGTSSGTTGVPTNLVLSAEDLDVFAEFSARIQWDEGLRPGDVSIVSYPPQHPVTKGDQGGAQRIGATPTQIAHRPDEVFRFVHALEHLEPKTLRIVSGPLIGALNSYFEEEDIDPQNIFEPVKSVTWGGEPLIESVKQEVESKWGVEMFNQAGGFEPMWLAETCSAQDEWMHFADDHFFVEAVDPDTGERVDEGERGELLITALSYEAMSHIRFAHDDIAEVRRGTCECGRTGTQIKVLGRVGDVVTVDGKDLLPIDVIRAVQFLEELPNNTFQFYPDSREALRLRLGAPEGVDVDALSQAVQDEVEMDVGVPVEIVDTVPEAEMMELGPGHKFPRIVNE